jgi:hypothetical protein
VPEYRGDQPGEERVAEAVPQAVSLAGLGLARSVHHVQLLAQKAADQRRRGAGVIGMVAVDEDVDVGLDVGEHAPDHVAFAPQGFVHDHGTDALRRGRRHIVGGVVIDIDRRARQCLAKGRNDLGDRRFLVVAGD